MPVEAARLVMIDARGAEHPICTPSALVGRGRECVVRFDSADVSREHLDVYFQEGTWWLRDLGSRNGTTVDGREVKGAGPVRLAAGSQIVLGGKKAGESLTVAGLVAVSMSDASRRARRWMSPGSETRTPGARAPATRTAGAQAPVPVAPGSPSPTASAAVAPAPRRPRWRSGSPRSCSVPVPSTEAGLYQLFDAAYVALRPWWVQERGGGTTLTVATISGAGLWVASVGDSPAYVDFGAGFELVTEPKQSHVLKEWLGTQDRPRPALALWRWPEHQIRGVLVTSDGVDPAAVSSIAPERTAGEIAAHLRSSAPLGATTPPHP